MSMVGKVGVTLFSLIQTNNTYDCWYAANTGPETRSYSGLYVPEPIG